jgi:hypothetical protein
MEKIMPLKIDSARKKGFIALLSIIIIGIGVFLGFTPLFDLVGGGVAGQVIGASFGAIFVIVLTMYLLNKQTELEQESKKSERVFEERVKFYNLCIDKIETIFSDDVFEREELSQLEFLLNKVLLLSEDETIDKFTSFYLKIAERANSPENQDEDNNLPIEIEDPDKTRFLEFIGQCRIELNLSEKELDERIKQKVTKSIDETSKAKAKKYIWQKIQESFKDIGKDAVDKKELTEYILNRHPEIKKNTLNCQITIQTVNNRSRTNFPVCKKPRLCDGEYYYDWLFMNEDKTLTRFDKRKHGTWEIFEREDGKLDVSKIK